MQGAMPARLNLCCNTRSLKLVWLRKPWDQEKASCSCTVRLQTCSAFFAYP